MASPAGAIVIESALVFATAGDSESVTCTVKFVVPEAVGVALFTQVEALMARPAGSEPTEIDHVYGVVPPVAVKVCEYATPCWPFDNEPVVIASPAAAIVIESALVFETVGDSESVTCTVKFVVPVPVGVPLMTPVEALMAKPAGSEPTEIDQV